jgi:hypothetical protein
MSRNLGSDEKVFELKGASVGIFTKLVRNDLVTIFFVTQLFLKIGIHKTFSRKIILNIFSEKHSYNIRTLLY